MALHHRSKIWLLGTRTARQDHVQRMFAESAAQLACSKVCYIARSTISYLPTKSLYLVSSLAYFLPAATFNLYINGTVYIHYNAGADEFAVWKLSFLPRRISWLTLSVLMSSVPTISIKAITMYV